MAYPYYALPSDNIANTATITMGAGSTQDPEYPKENLVNLNPAKPGKLLETQGGWVFNFGSAKSIEMFGLIHNNLTPTLSVKLQGNASDSWGSPSLDQTLTIPAKAQDSFSVDPWLDLTGITHSYQYWRLWINAANAAPVAVGEVVFSTARRILPCHMAPNFTDLEEYPVVEHRTDHGVSTVYPLGTRWRSWEGEMPTVDDSGVTALRTLARDARGRGRGFLFIPDPAVNEAWFCRLGASKYTVRRYMVNINYIPFTIQEVSRGLYL